jgi:hypothetical protein
MPPEQYDGFNATIEVNVTRNDLNKPSYDSLKRDTNVAPTAPFVLTRNDFCNLILPSDYRLYVLGWISKLEFLSACWQYEGWVWPLNSVSPYHNQAWSQITEADEKTLTNAGFAAAIKRNPTSVKAGWLKTTGKGGGACCYYFPNIGKSGGVKETNLYVLPQDLHVVSEIGKT